MGDTDRPPCLPHVCACGATYTAEEWWALPFPASGVDLWDDGVVALRLRNCRKCGTTFAQVLPESAAALVVQAVAASPFRHLGVEEPALVARLRDIYGLEPRDVRAGLALAVLDGRLSPTTPRRADAPPNVLAYVFVRQNPR